MDLYPHQQKALAEMHNGCILRGGVGSGKSRTAMAYYMEKEAPRDVYIITTAKKRDSLDWNGEAARFGVGTVKNATVAGVLTVDSWNNIGRYKDVRGAFFIFDEQRTVGSGVWATVFTRIAAHNHWILLSATPGDNWLDYISVFVANGFYKNRTEFKREHVVYNSFTKFPKVERYIGTGRLLKYKNMILVEMPYPDEKRRLYKTIQCDFDQNMMDMVLEERWNPYTNEPLKNVADLFFNMRKVVNSDPSRLETIRVLLIEHPRLVVFYNFDYELENLRTLSNWTNLAEWNGHRHQPIPDEERWVYLVQYMAGSEGWNCTETNAIVFHSLSYSYKMYHQAQGRIDRLDTKFSSLYFYTLISKSSIDQAIWRALNRKKNFNENRYKYDTFRHFEK